MTRQTSAQRRDVRVPLLSIPRRDEGVLPCAKYPDPGIFQDPKTPDEVEAAKNMCVTCPFKDGCLEQGLVNKEWGIWGGVLLNEGKVVRRHRLLRTPRATAAGKAKVAAASASRTETTEPVTAE